MRWSSSFAELSWASDKDYTALRREAPGNFAAFAPIFVRSPFGVRPRRSPPAQNSQPFCRNPIRSTARKQAVVQQQCAACGGRCGPAIMCHWICLGVRCLPWTSVGAEATASRGPWVRVLAGWTRWQSDSRPIAAVAPCPPDEPGAQATATPTSPERERRGQGSARDRIEPRDRFCPASDEGLRGAVTPPTPRSRLGLVARA